MEEFKVKSWVRILINFLLILLLIGLPVIFGLLDMQVQMGLSVASISLALLFSNLDRFTKFKAGGVEAEMKIAVDKAYAAVEQLKDLALVLSEPIIHSMTHTGTRQPLEHFTRKEKLQFVLQIEGALSKLNASQEEIGKVGRKFNERIVADFYKALVAHLIQNNRDIDFNQKFGTLLKGEFQSWTPEQIRKFIENNDLKTTVVIKDIIRDFDYWIKNRDIRRDIY